MKTPILIAAGLLLSVGCAAQPASTPTAAPTAASTPTTYPAPTADVFGDSIDVYVDRTTLTCGGLSINNAELPIFVKEIVGTRRVILRPMYGTFPSRYVEARDQLKAAGVTNLVLGPFVTR